ncbi:hypothetical protein [Paraburkholderia sp. BL10I2N1]|uniref:hypothetical protein n=1 Tax=Paraburkholderia sp. BL10I2N1 TaxID=1938796 RepID=UPI00105F259B|nr:hypothetical protein [Paraburkholderia sp. BL10I2N1]TDN63218.1 hypothetical protein B0G77_6853 [Paraburkholderia sp. BL10I2N1]
MATELNASFDLYRANLDLALRMVTFGLEGRRDGCAFQTQRINRDLAAIRKLQEASSRSKDLNEYNAACQSMLQDYLTASTSIWQEALGSAVRNQTAFGDDMREALQGWQSAWTTQCKKAADASGAGTPIQEWMQRFEQAIAGAIPGTIPGTIPGGDKRAEPAQAAAEGGRAKKGEPHVG